MIAALASKGQSSLGSIGGDLLGLKSSGSLFIGMLRSQTAQERIVEQFGLRKIYGEKFLSDARTELDRRTSTVEDRKSGIITIAVTDRSPERAAAIAAAYVSQLNILVSQVSTSSARRERVFLEERLKIVKQDLDDASNQLAQFSSKNGTLDVQQEGKAMLDAASSLAGQMIAAQSQLEGLRQIYTDSNPRVRSLSARVEDLRKELNKLAGTTSVATVPGDKSTSKTSDMPLPSIRNLPLLGVKYTDYYRRAKIEETVYEMLTEQYELAKVQEAKETPIVKVLDPAQVPERKSWPPRLVIIVMGSCVALIGGVLWVLGGAVWEKADPTDPRKVLIGDAIASLKAHRLNLSRNGHETDRGLDWD